MTVKPIRLCAKGHEAHWTRASLEEGCPFCAALAEVERLTKELALLRLGPPKAPDGKV